MFGRFSAVAVGASLADLVRWIKREGGFVHHAVKLSQDTPFGVGLISTKKIREGTDLISLPPHVPLRFESDDAPSSSLLAALARRGPRDLQNSFSVVWEGRHLVHGTVVAIKEIAMSRLNKKLQDSLMLEIFILKKINHPNIIRFIDMIEAPRKIQCLVDNVTD